MKKLAVFLIMKNLFSTQNARTDWTLALAWTCMVLAVASATALLLHLDTIK